VGETYAKVGGKWSYLYRAVDKHGNTIDLYLSSTRNTAAAKRSVINTDKVPTDGAALSELKAEGKCPEDTESSNS
jgi:transposase, IS6 family